MEVKSDLDNDVSNASNKIADKMRESLKGYSNDSVSYTHLTLPTNSLV